MTRIEFDDYILYTSFDACSIFEEFEMINIHGLNYYDCIFFDNSNDDTYIAGWCNLIPNSDKYYVFINLSRCNSDIETFGLLMHELMHLSIHLHNEDLKFEEEIITWAESEAYKLFPIIKNELQTNHSLKEDTTTQK